MNAIGHLFTSIVAGTIVFSGCGSPHGKPAAGSDAVAPSEVVEFRTLYKDNCSGCHGADGRGGAALALGNPVYLAIADEGAMRNVITNGVSGTSMPAFAQSAGGMLTDKQIDVIVTGIRSRWGHPGILDGAHPPTYAAKLSGDPKRGEAAYKNYCESCHGAAGQGGAKGSAITNNSFLALVSDQGLRTLVIAGRPELGAPDWRGNAPGKPMSDQDITDVVAWLRAQRPKFPGQPYSPPSKAGQ